MRQRAEYFYRSAVTAQREDCIVSPTELLGELRTMPWRFSDACVAMNTSLLECALCFGQPASAASRRGIYDKKRATYVDGHIVI